jgi:hypothetical protein
LINEVEQKSRLLGGAHQIQLTTYCLTYIRRPKISITLKVATAIFAETLDNFQHLTGLIPDS